MEQQKPKGGSIIATSSTTALRGFPAHPAYTMAKGGIVSLVRALAVEYGPSNIRVNSIAPGTTKTNLTDESVSINKIIGEIYIIIYLQIHTSLYNFN